MGIEFHFGKMKNSGAGQWWLYKVNVGNQC